MTSFCRATLNYTDGAGDRMGARREIEVEILDGRSADLPGWETCGLELVRHHSSLDDWTDDDAIASVHYAEVEALARSLTGADAALVSDHVKRNAGAVKGHREQAPVGLVHSDFAADYAEIVRQSYREVHGRGLAALARSGLTSNQIESAPRVVMMQFWRNLGAAKMDLPLAFCDARTVDPSEARPFHYTGYVAGGRTFDALAIAAPDDPSRHHWYTFPEMTVEEVVAFRTYDTELVAAGRTHFTPHSAFRDPEVELLRPARFSIELRVMCVYL